MPDSEQIELIDAHPRLGAPPSSVSALSFARAGLRPEATTAMADLDRLNREYEAKFGFRFCVFVAGRSRSELVPVLEAALAAERTAEIQRALGRRHRHRPRTAFRKAGLVAASPEGST